MSVQISELEVVPRENQLAQQAQQQQQAQPGGQQPPQPEKEHEFARAVALLHERNLRLRAD
jgi:hypothetical protein